MRLILLAIGILYTIHLVGQPSKKQTVLFDLGKASISLQQLDSIKNIAKLAQRTTTNKLLIYAYANDAVNGASNLRLSRQRAFLMQQCFEREGIALDAIHIQNKVRRQNELAACAACAEIYVTTDSHLFNRDIYHQQILNYMQSFSKVEKQAFLIDADKDEIIVTKEGLVLFVPAGTLAASGVVDISLRYISNTWDRLMFQLDTRSHRQQFLSLESNIFIGAKQHNEAVEMRNNRSIILVMPGNQYIDNPQVYQHEGANWFRYPRQKSARTGSFYGSDYCSDLADFLEPPSYPLPPSKPTYKKLEPATNSQDEQLQSIDLKLANYAAMKLDKKGKIIGLNAQLRTKEAALKLKKNRLLIAKENILVDVRSQNKGLEKEYLKTLAQYNNNRNNLQRSYLKGLDSIRLTQKKRQKRCLLQLENLKELKASYPQDIFEQISAVLRNTTPDYTLGYWTEVNQLGWMCVAKTQSTNTEKLVPFRVLSDVSAYQVAAFLLFENEAIVQGEAIDETDIVFWEVPEGKKATLIAVTKHKAGFKIAFQQVETNGHPQTIEYNYKELSSLLPHIH